MEPSRYTGYCGRIFLLILAFSIYAEYTEAGGVRVVLTANVTDFKNPDELFEVISRYAGRNGGRDTLVWVLNGDIFPESMNDQDISQWKLKANGILDKHQRLFILLNQGDRDWMDSGEDGLTKIRAIEKLLSEAEHTRFKVFFKHGCPGPWAVAFASLEIVVLNSQWWNHPFDKPSATSNACAIADTDNFFEELEDVMDKARPKRLLILSHFPLVSLGSYGGRFPLSAYLLPPKVAFRQHVGTSKDIVNEHFERFRYRLSNLLEDHSSIILASGHEINHSILKVGHNFHINSGALAASRFSARSKHALLRSSETGFVEIEFNSNGKVDFTFVQITSQRLRAEMTGTMLDSSVAEHPKDPNRPRTGNATPNARAIAGKEYKSGWLRRLWFGQHYRLSWTTPVQVPYLDLDTTDRGLTFTGLGGGRQTTSLKIAAGNGKRYVFRSVDKDPFRALDFQLRGTVMADILKDQTSTQQPFGALAVAPLLDRTGILHAAPRMYLLPDDERLGKFRSDYKNLLGMLEEQPNSKVANDRIFGGAVELSKSFKTFRKLYHDHDNSVDSREFAKARMFDLWIGDWSKHEDNWKWAGFMHHRGTIYRPIPRDRDHAFSRWDGIIPWLADREWAVPNGENFGDKIEGIRSLMWQARHLDRFVASELNKEDWIAAARQITDSITERDIENAVRSMPKEIYETDGREIERKLKLRLKDLEIYAAQYYQLLSKVVDVVGSNKKEFFRVVRNADASVAVTVTGISHNSEPDSSRVFYHRIFKADETAEIRLYGLEGDDFFDISGSAERSILVRIVSGDGSDVIRDLSNVAGRAEQTLLYEKSPETSITAGNELKSVKPKNPALYEYNRNAFAYNTYMPVALLTYNPFIGPALHAGVTFTRQNFSKPDFSSKHAFRAAVSFEGDYDLSYRNSFRQVIGKWDGVSEIGISRPLDFNYFFGAGNDTPYDKELPSDYYRSQYNSITASAGLEREFWKKSLLELTFNYEANEGIKRNESYLADHPEVFGVGKLHLFYIKGRLDLDLRDRAALPERGFLFRVDQQAGASSISKRNLSTITEAAIEQYVSTYQRNPVTLGVRIGGGFSEGQIPFYKLLSIGQDNDLRGYKRNRFSGHGKGYLNTELRYQLIHTSNTFVPIKVGVRGFFDIGRIWVEGDQAARYWHKGYGGGVYVVPFREQFAINVSAGSSREEALLVMVSVGTFLR